MEYSCISSLINIFESLKCLILCFISCNQTKFNTAYGLIAQIVYTDLFKFFEAYIIVINVLQLLINSS
jgi:hypothetical protein